MFAIFDYKRHPFYEVIQKAAKQHMSKKLSSRLKRSGKRVVKRKVESVIPGADLNALTSMVRDALAQFTAAATEGLGKASRNLANFPIEVQVKLLALMQTGWALDPDQPILFVRLVEGEFGKEHAMEALVASHFESRMGEIQATLAKRHPERAAIQADAFDAHLRGLYTLSVPVLLAQADGIVGDRFKRKQLFSKSGEHCLSSLIKEMEPGQLSTMWAEILSGEAEVSANVRSLPAGFAGLNRHAVLHGTDLQYGTRHNSLKALSMLYMASHLVASNSNGKRDPIGQVKLPGHTNAQAV